VKRSEKGFSVLELMVAAGVASVLASVAVPRLMKNATAAKRAEAYAALGTIARMEDAFFQSRGYYAATFDELGYMMSGGKAKGVNAWVGQRYTYALTTLNGGTNYAAVAVGNIDGDTFQDLLYVSR
jgi:prepilin-type N-terminal cleavage/methylation domain-containing protein